MQIETVRAEAAVQVAGVRVELAHEQEERRAAQSRAEVAERAQQEASDEVAALKGQLAVVETAHAEAARARDLAQEAARTLEQALTVASSERNAATGRVDDLVAQAERARAETQGVRQELVAVRTRVDTLTDALVQRAVSPDSNHEK